MHERKCIFHKNRSFEQFECIMLELIMMFIKQIMSLKVDDVKINTKQHHLNGDTVQDVVLLLNRKVFQIHSNLVLMCSSCPN